MRESSRAVRAEQLRPTPIFHSSGTSPVQTLSTSSRAAVTDIPFDDMMARSKRFPKLDPVEQRHEAFFLDIEHSAVAAAIRAVGPDPGWIKIRLDQFQRLDGD